VVALAAAALADRLSYTTIAIQASRKQDELMAAYQRARRRRPPPYTRRFNKSRIWLAIVDWLQSPQPHLIRGIKTAPSMKIGVKLKQGRVVQNILVKLDRSVRPTSAWP